MHGQQNVKIHKDVKIVKIHYNKCPKEVVQKLMCTTGYYPPTYLSIEGCAL